MAGSKTKKTQRPKGLKTGRKTAPREGGPKRLDELEAENKALFEEKQELEKLVERKDERIEESRKEFETGVEELFAEIERLREETQILKTDMVSRMSPGVVEIFKQNDELEERMREMAKEIEVMKREKDEMTKEMNRMRKVALAVLDFEERRAWEAQIWRAAARKRLENPATAAGAEKDDASVRRAVGLAFEKKDDGEVEGDEN